MDDIEKKTGVNKTDIFKLADSVQNANLQDEKTIRQLIAQVSRLAGIPVSKEKEEQIVNQIINKNIPLDMTSIAKMFKQK